MLEGLAVDGTPFGKKVFLNVVFIFLMCFFFTYFIYYKTNTFELPIFQLSKMCCLALFSLVFSLFNKYNNLFWVHVCGFVIYFLFKIKWSTFYKACILYNHLGRGMSMEYKDEGNARPTIWYTCFADGEEAGQPQQFLVRATISSCSRPSHVEILVLSILFFKCSV